MGLRAEQETVIRWDEAEKVVHIWSASPVTWRRMARLALSHHKETTMEGNLSGRFYRVPLARFRWGLKRGGIGHPYPESLRRWNTAKMRARGGQTGEQAGVP